MTVAELITAGIELVNDFALMPFITATAVAGLGAMLYRRFKSASR